MPLSLPQGLRCGSCWFILPADTERFNDSIGRWPLAARFAGRTHSTESGDQGRLWVLAECLPVQLEPHWHQTQFEINAIKKKKARPLTNSRSGVNLVKFTWLIFQISILSLHLCDSYISLSAFYGWKKICNSNQNSFSASPFVYYDLLLLKITRMWIYWLTWNMSLSIDLFKVSFC